MRGSSWEVSHLAFDSSGTYLAIAHTAPFSEEQSGDVLEVWDIAQQIRDGQPIAVLGRVSWMAILQPRADRCYARRYAWPIAATDLEPRNGPTDSRPQASSRRGCCAQPKWQSLWYRGRWSILRFSAAAGSLLQCNGLGARANRAAAKPAQRHRRPRRQPSIAPVLGSSRGMLMGISDFRPCRESLGQTGRSLKDEPRKRREDVLTGHSGSITSLAVHPNGKILASGSEDGTIRLWHLQARQPLVPPDKPNYVSGTGFDSFTGALVDLTEFTSPDPHGEPVLRSFEPEDTVYQWDRRETSVGFSFGRPVSAGGVIDRSDLALGPSARQASHQLPPWAGRGRRHGRRGSIR